MTPRLLKLSLVLVLLTALSATQACKPAAPGEGRVELGCCWKKTGKLVICSATTLKKDCPAGYTWVAKKNCGTPECGGLAER